MKIQNPTAKTLEELKENLSLQYPGAKIRKPFLGIGPRNLILPAKEGLKHVVRPNKANTVLTTDFIPPVLVIILGLVLSVVLVSVFFSIMYGQLVWGIGGGLWIALGVLAVKYIYKAMKKDYFEQFHNDLNMAVTKSQSPDSIF